MFGKETFRKLSPEQEALNFFIWEILPSIDKISNEDIQRFRDQEVLPEYRSNFDKYKDNSKLSIVAITNLTDEQLSKLKKFCNTELEQLHIVGLHDIFSELARLYRITQNPKYER